MSARSATKPVSNLALRLLSGAYCAKDKRSADASVQGLSLIECLVAIVVIAITVTAITPPVFLATATRIQSRRAEQANQIAQGEVDRIRTVVERGLYTAQNLPASTGSDAAAASFPVATGIAPTLMSMGSGACQGTYPPTPTVAPAPPATAIAADQLIPVDVDGIPDPASGQCGEYLMQVFRTKGCIPTDFAAQPAASQPAPYSFTVGVRVYAYVPGENLPGLSPERATLGLTTWRKDINQNNLRQPLQTLYVKMTRTNTAASVQCAGRSTSPSTP